jgi:hypothetical protein
MDDNEAVVGASYGFNIVAEKFIEPSTDKLVIKLRISSVIEEAMNGQPHTTVTMKFPINKILAMSTSQYREYLTQYVILTLHNSKTFSGPEYLEKALISLGLKEKPKYPIYAKGGLIVGNSGGFLTSGSVGYHQYYNSQSWQSMGFVASNTLSVAAKASRLPGMDYVTKCPKCPTVGPLYNLVQHYNDGHKCTREEIADWLDDLHDSGKVDLSFTVKDTDERKSDDQ